RLHSANLDMSGPQPGWFSSGGEVREARQEMSEEHFTFKAGERCPDATVDAVIERHVPVGPAGDAEFARVVELSRGTICRGEHLEDEGPGRQFCLAEHRILLDQPRWRNVDRRLHPQ